MGKRRKKKGKSLAHTNELNEGVDMSEHTGRDAGGKQKRKVFGIYI